MDLALRAPIFAVTLADLLRRAVVLGSALALAFAGRTLPF